MLYRKICMHCFTFLRFAVRGHAIPGHRFLDLMVSGTDRIRLSCLPHPRTACGGVPPTGVQRDQFLVPWDPIGDAWIRSQVPEGSPGAQCPSSAWPRLVCSFSLEAAVSGKAVENDFQKLKQQKDRQHITQHARCVLILAAVNSRAVHKGSSGAYRQTYVHRCQCVHWAAAVELDQA